MCSLTSPGLSDLGAEHSCHSWTSLSPLGMFLIRPSAQHPTLLFLSLPLSHTHTQTGSLSAPSSRRFFSPPLSLPPTFCSSSHQGAATGRAGGREGGREKGWGEGGIYLPPPPPTRTRSVACAPPCCIIHKCVVLRGCSPASELTR